MRNLFLVLTFSIISSCTTDDAKVADVGSAEKKQIVARQLNISVLWDLSDRVDPKKHPSLPTPAEKDIAIIKDLAEYMKATMNSEGAYRSKGKLKIFFSPAPSDPTISRLASMLDVDLSNKSPKEKKIIYDSIATNFESAANAIMNITLKTSKWEGSDIYRFFKNNAEDCIDRDTSYRNILILLTDGYILHPSSMGRIENKTEYLTGTLFNSLKLRNNQNFKETFISKKCGLIAKRNDLSNLEILVLEVDPEPKHSDDEDIIKIYLEQWFNDMSVKIRKIYTTDLPINTQKKIHQFLDSK